MAAHADQERIAGQGCQIAVDVVVACGVRAVSRTVTGAMEKIDAAGRGLGRIGLLPAIIFALVASAIVAGLAYGVLR